MSKVSAVILVILLALFALPIISIIALSVLSIDGSSVSFTLEQYRLAISDSLFLKCFLNSVRMTGMALIIHIPISLIGGLLIARGRARLSKTLMIAYAVALLLPFQVIMLPVYKISLFTGIYDSQWSVIVLAAVSPLGPIAISALIKGLPEEQWEAASIESASFTRVLFSVILPQVAAGAAILIILTFSDIWNMVEQPLILISSPYEKPISLTLNDFVKGKSEHIWAGSVMYMLPVIILYIPLARFLSKKRVFI